ncbi:MAG: allophanate hydrolase [Patulibacter sp.]
MTTPAPEPIGAVLGRVRRGEQSVTESALAARARAASHGAPASTLFAAPGGPAAGRGPVDAAWIDLLDEPAIRAAARRAGETGLHAPLVGVPVAVKGNIDVEGLPTTAACPTFASGAAQRSATAVRRLQEAGAVVLGTTNLDQFATGLNGTRSPYGAPHAVGHPGRISGGSSSGSAVAVARGDVPLALGTDTAGSGRVPAALNGIVGLKPSKGLISTAGVLPACRSQDVVSIFTADVDSAALTLEVLARPDPDDPWSRCAPPPPVAAPARDGLVLGVPASLAGIHADVEATAAWEQALEVARSLDVPGGVTFVPVDLAPFLEAGAMLYGSALVAERYASVGAFIDAAIAAAEGGAESVAALDPTVAAIVLDGKRLSAAEAFAAIDRLRALLAQTHAVLATVDALLTPTVLEHPTQEQLAADPVALNARLGTFTTFGNLLDLSVLAVPSRPRTDGLPFGVSFHAPAFHERRLLALGAHWERAARAHANAGTDSGAAGVAAGGRGCDANDRLLVAVGGAHMAGLAANAELLEAGGEYVRLTRTASNYRLHVLETPVGPRPGIERFAGEGAGVEVELWSVSSQRLGWFSGKVPPGLALGPMTLLDGSRVLGFVAAAADDVGGAPLVPSWRAFALR